MFYKLNCNQNVVKNLSNKIITIKLMILVVFIYVHIFSQELLTDFFHIHINIKQLLDIKRYPLYHENHFMKR